MYSRPDPYAAERLTIPDPDVDEAALDRAPATLSEMGERLLDIVRAAAVSRGTALPGRQSVYMAPIPADCEQVAVLFTGWNPTPPPDGPTVCKPWRWLAPYSVIITRCTPAVPKVARGKGTTVAPAPEKMIEAARLSSEDAEVLLEVVNRLDEIGGDVSIVANAPSGGFQTVELNVQLLPTGSL
jgi:hypothetical protein